MTLHINEYTLWPAYSIYHICLLYMRASFHHRVILIVNNISVNRSKHAACVFDGQLIVDHLVKFVVTTLCDHQRTQFNCHTTYNTF